MGGDPASGSEPPPLRACPPESPAPSAFQGPKLGWSACGGRGQGQPSGLPGACELGTRVSLESLQDPPGACCFSQWWWPSREARAGCWSGSRSAKEPASPGSGFICGLGSSGFSLPNSRGAAGKGRNQRGPDSLTPGTRERGRRCQRTQASPPPAPPCPSEEKAPGSPGSHRLPRRPGALPALARALGPPAPPACNDEMTAWAASHGDGFQALKWAERDEHLQEGHFFLNFGARRTRCVGPRPARLASLPCSPGTAEVLTVHTSSGRRGRGGAHARLGQGGGVLGIALGLAPRGLPSWGPREKVPG